MRDYKEGEGYQQIKDNAISLVNSLEIKNKLGFYKKDPTEEHSSMYGTYHAVHILDMFGCLDSYSEKQKDNFAKIINDTQGEQGYFINNPNGRNNPRSVSQLDPIWHFTRGMIWTLRVLKRKSHYDLSFLEPLLSKKAMYDYVKHYDWSNSWAAGNQICAIATAMFALRDWYGVPFVDEVLEYGMYPALEELFDPKTGYWGTQYGADKYNGMFGTIHIAPVYYSQKWPIRSLEACIDSTLDCQYSDGSFWPCGSDCPDFDGAYMLYNLTNNTSYKKEEIIKAADLYISHALMHLSEDGVGYRIHRKDTNPSQWVSRPHFIWEEGKDKATEEYRDEDPTRTKIMLGSWFYPLSIALASRMGTNKKYDGPYKLTPESLHECNFK
ncbi:MAG: hypothetical protein PHD05_06090 [Sphaerochaetaceae bacterium]|nr:hypothetical protein [Sphaerochaetaceae bacterium]